ncbi:MAG: PH domain-containing protein [Steroidobacteraceae bacterium]
MEREYGAPWSRWLRIATSLGLTVLLLVALLATLPFMVRGVPGEMRGSVRLFGNGGLFAITGWFWNRRLGRYRAFATDPDRAVLLEFARGKVLVTPHDPQAFIVQARRQLA